MKSGKLSFLTRIISDCNNYASKLYGTFPPNSKIFINKFKKVESKTLYILGWIGT